MTRAALFGASAVGLDAERVHRLAMWSLSAFSRVCAVDLPATDVARDPRLARQAFGITFPNPLGLAAGFDKDAECVPAWHALGFGFVEVGTVTAKPQPGNPKPRLFRLQADRALFNRLGFNNHGAEACARAIDRWRSSGRVRIPLGVNIGKSKVTDNAHAKDDYRASFRAVADGADYIVVNVSSPNTPGLRDLQRRDELVGILDAVMGENRARQTARPVLVKLAPDLAVEDARACADAAVEHGVAGLVLTNTTQSRDGLVGTAPEGAGGISGAPLFARSTALLTALHESHGGKLTFVGVGGISDGDTLAAKLQAGAALAQVYTGFVYGGPGFVRTALRGMLNATPALPRPS